MNSSGTSGQSVEIEIENLRREINRHNELYYVHSQPEISDAEFDALLARLDALENVAMPLSYANVPRTERLARAQAARLVRRCPGREGLERRGFTFNNPNAVKTCGCGSHMCYDERINSQTISP